MAKAIVPQLNASSSTTRQERFDLIETRTNMARTILSLLLIAMDDDCPPNEGQIITAISAAIELTSITEVVA